VSGKTLIDTSIIAVLIAAGIAVTNFLLENSFLKNARLAVISWLAVQKKL